VVVPQTLRGMMYFRALPLFAALILAAPSVNAAMQGIWAATGELPFVSQKAPLKDIWSPNHEIVLREGDDGLFVIGKQTTLLQDILATPSITEILWSPDSKAFVVNGSDGGAVGEWKAHFYTLDDEDRPVARDLAGLIEPLVRTFPRCGDDEPYTNLGAVAWLKDGKELLVARGP
jgi:hypothetical protein